MLLERGCAAGGRRCTLLRSTVQQKTILLADDRARDRAGAALRLRRQGFTVLAAANALEAAYISASREGRLDLVLARAEMAGISGAQLARMFAGRFPDLAVVPIHSGEDIVGKAKDALAAKKPAGSQARVQSRRRRA
ncbi:MAG: response regulator [Acidobacteria bacterium]|nr:response regulator [Acidobacteriota bacterium]